MRCRAGRPALVCLAINLSKFSDTLYRERPTRKSAGPGWLGAPATAPACPRGETAGAAGGVKLSPGPSRSPRRSAEASEAVFPAAAPAAQRLSTRGPCVTRLC